ncbi:MAG TPA: recombination mediator RecR [Verrucomicrobiaceae bacterium]|jgi:recombination protein RecR
MNAGYPAPLQRLILLLKSLPGLGPRSAERLVLWLMGRGHARVPELAEALAQLSQQVAECPECGFFMERGAECAFCRSGKRDKKLLCVVETAADVLRLERSGAFHGLYHVLGGKLAPLDNVTPADLRIEPLARRVHDLAAEEVILALGSDVEGESTAHYLADLLRPLGVKITRLAQGMPAGGGLEQVDELTLHQALSGRRPLGN